MCFGSLSCCRTQVRFSLRSRTDGRTLSFRIFGRQQNSWFHLSQQVFQVLKQQNSPRPLHTTTTIFYCWYVLFLKCCYFYARCNGTHTFQKVQTFVSPQSIFPKVLGIIKMFSGKTETSLYVLFAQQRFCLGTLPCRPFLPSLFLMVES